MRRWHRYWQKLPRAWRQLLFHAVTSAGVPRADGGVPGASPEPVVVAGVLRAATGLGQAARLAVHALRSAGIPYTTADLTEALFQRPSEPFDPGPVIAEGPGTLLMFVTPPNVPLALRAIGSRKLAGKRRIGAWVCETERLPPLWRRQAGFLHEVAAPSRFSQAAIAKAIGRPVRLLIHPVEAEPWPPEAGPRAAGTTLGAVLDIGSSSARKNVDGMIECCIELLALRPDAKVAWKVRDAGADPEVAARLAAAASSHPDRIALHSEDWSREGVLAFLDSIDLLLSFSRAEGFGLPIAEAMRRGVAVAAPVWGGPADYLDARCAIPLPFRLTPILDPSGLYRPSQGVWADVDPGEGARVLSAVLGRQVVLDPMVTEARRRSHDLFSVHRFIEQLRHESAGPRPDAL